MLSKSVLDRFVQSCPAAVMVRATIENLLRPQRIDQIFADAAQRQYLKKLVFSDGGLTHSPVNLAVLSPKRSSSRPLQSMRLRNRLHMRRLGALR